MEKEPSKISFSRLGRRLEEPVITGLITRALERPELISLAAGFTDNRKLPLEIVKRALAELDGRDGDPEYLQYGTTQGRPLLRERVAEFLAKKLGERRDYYKGENIIISNGSQQTLYLAMQVLCDPGDIVFVEGPSYFVFLELLKGLGIKAVTMPMMENGDLDLEGLDALIGKMEAEGQLNRVKGVYLVSYYANPSSHSMPLKDKKGLAGLLKRRRLCWPILEDAAYREVHYEKPYPVPTVLSLPEFEGIPRLYLGTFTKPFSCGFKIGYGCCTDKEWLSKMLYVKGHHDFGSSNFTQALLEVVLDKGWYDEWLDELHGHYKAKAECFEEVVAEEGLEELGWKWARPEGGLMVWAHGPEGLDASIDSEFYEACLDNGVFYVPGDLCFAEGHPKNCVRLSIGSLQLDRLREGLKRFIKTAREFSLVSK